MKKFLAVLILLLIIAGTVFYFGWVQIRLSEQTYGVIFTKTSGYHSEVIRPGTFVWKWERLIPTNFTMHRFSLEPHTVTVSREGMLPSGEVYAGALQESPDFSYTLDFTLSYELLPEALPSLVEEEALDPDSFDTWHEKQSQEILATISSLLSGEIEQIDSASPTELEFGKLEELLLEELKSSFPQLRFHAVTPRQIKIPDFTLYYTAREHYFDLLDTRKTTERETLEKARSWKVSEEAKLEVLKKYGQLFTEYPGLIRYLALQDQQSLDNMVPRIELIEQLFGEDVQGKTPDTADDTGTSGQTSPDSGE